MLFNNSADRILETLTGLTLTKIEPREGLAISEDARSIKELEATINSALGSLGSICLGLADKDISDVDLALAAKNLANALDELTKLCHAIMPKFSDPSTGALYLNQFLDSAVAASRLLLVAKASMKDPSLQSVKAESITALQSTLKKVSSVVTDALSASQAATHEFNGHIAALDKVTANPQPMQDATPTHLKTIARDLMEAVNDLTTSTTDSEALIHSESIPRLLQDLISAALGIPNTMDCIDLLKDFLSAAMATADALRNLMKVNMSLPPRTEHNKHQTQHSFTDVKNQFAKTMTGTSLHPTSTLSSCSFPFRSHRKT